MQIVDPAGTTAVASKMLAPRPRSLEGATIALLDNSKPNAGVLLERAGALLAARTGARAVKLWSKPSASSAAAPAVIEEIAAAARVVLTASAD